ncbi:hypothetical protein H7Y63_03685 [Polaromonas sp.]|nr:hypothetical protein [Candidatus Saccharibacteria bacterium]
MSVPEQFSPGTPETATLADRIQYWQDIFDAVPADESAESLRIDAQEDLDRLWPHMSQLCDIRGMAKLEEWNYGSVSSRAEFIDFDTAESFGLVIAKIGATATEKWRVCYGFEKIYGDAIDTRTYQTFYLLPKLASISPHVEIEKIFEGIYQPHDILSAKSSELAEELQDPVFLGLHKEEQQYVIEERLSAVMHLVNQWGGIEGPINIEEATRAYIRVGGGASAEFEEIDIEDVEIGGTCLGLEVLARARLLNGRAIDDVDQLVDSEAGLFLKILVDPETARDCYLEDYQDVYIPISGQRLGVYFAESVDAD